MSRLSLDMTKWPSATTQENAGSFSSIKIFAKTVTWNVPLVDGQTLPPLPIFRLTNANTSWTSSTRNKNATPKNATALTRIVAKSATSLAKKRKCSQAPNQQ